MPPEVPLQAIVVVNTVARTDTISPISSSPFFEQGFHLSNCIVQWRNPKFPPSNPFEETNPHRFADTPLLSPFRTGWNKIQGSIGSPVATRSGHLCPLQWNTPEAPPSGCSNMEPVSAPSPCSRCSFRTHSLLAVPTVVCIVHSFAVHTNLSINFDQCRATDRRHRPPLPFFSLSKGFRSGHIHPT